MEKYITIWDRYISRLLEKLSRLSVGVSFVVYALVTYLGLLLCGEQELTESLTRFVYFVVVTISTVGYGDFSPSTQAGQIFAGVWIIPVGLGVFGLIIGKAAYFFSSLAYRRFRGQHMLDINNHIVILGYNKTRTPHLIKMIQREETGRRDIVLVSVELEENPFSPDTGIQFISASSFTDEQDLKRAKIEQASTIVVDTDSDEMTLTIALFVAPFNQKANMVANFIDEVKCKILNQHIPNAECISNLGTELLAKSVIDAGSSLVHSELVSTHKGQTNYSVTVPAGVAEFTLNDIFTEFKQRHEATVIAIRKHNETDVQINANLTTVVSTGDQIFYIADERIHFENWPAQSS